MHGQLRARSKFVARHAIVIFTVRVQEAGTTELLQGPSASQPASQPTGRKKRVGKEGARQVQDERAPPPGLQAGLGHIVLEVVRLGNNLEGTWHTRCLANRTFERVRQCARATYLVHVHGWQAPQEGQDFRVLQVLKLVLEFFQDR